ncbi:hypothetical protein H5410_022226 [Solanum commersonii]|uniref:Uncharacterized protein n=1 Tax=Solanum commersonii TaxID=4109 RepID=A0A9J5ZDM2_SOLCO|nr:hypothetical protein H5410_022226 [Solanum commersonii]
MNAKIESLEKAIVTMKSKRDIRPSSKISHPYTPDYVKRTKRQISVALSSARKKKKGKNEGADMADEGADSNSRRSRKSNAEWAACENAFLPLFCYTFNSLLLYISEYGILKLMN